MWRQRYSLLILSLIALGFLAANTAYVAGWSKTEMTVSAGSTAPTVDGVKESLWTDLTVNITYHTFTTSSRQISLSALTFGGSLYVLIEANFVTSQQNESISIFLSSTNQTANETAFLDKKMITMFNATQYGNESSIAIDYYRVGVGNYSIDKDSAIFTGKAKMGSPTRNPRVYEFQIPLNPANLSYDVAWTMSKNYAIKVGINNTLNDIEISDAFLLQLGQRLTLTEKKFGEFDIDPQVFLNVVLIIIDVIYGIVGVVIFVSRSNVESIGEEPTSTVSTDSEKKSEKDDTEKGDEPEITLAEEDE